MSEITIIWHGQPSHVAQVRRELHELIDRGLKRPEDLIIHTVFVGSDMHGPSIVCWGVKGDAAFHAEYAPVTNWISGREQSK